MIGKVVLLALLVAAVSASPVTKNTTTVNYGDAITQFLQAWKQMLPCGYAPDNIPVMAPLTSEFESFNYTRGETSLVGNTSNIRISGLNHFEMLNGVFDTSSQKASFDVLFPEIQILGSYAIEGVISMFGFVFPLREVGLINERFQQLRIVGEYTFGQSLINPNGLRISEFHLQFYLADVKIDNWDTLLDIAVNDYSNQWSSQIFSLLVKQIQPNVDPLLAAYVIPSVNDLLSAFSLNQLSELFISTANKWNSANCQVHA